MDGSGHFTSTKLIWVWGCIVKYKKITLTFGLIILIGLAFLIGNKGNRYSIFFDSSCKAPCWQKIHPGITTEEEALTILKGVSNIDPQKISTRGEKWMVFDDTVIFQSTSKNWDGRAYILDHKVILIMIYGNLNTNFREAIDVNGNPKYVLNVPILGGLPGLPETNYAITALDPEKGIAYTYNIADLPKSKRSELRSDTPISLISYFDPDKYDVLLEAEIFSMSSLGREETIKYLRPWTGYGSINDKYPPARVN